MRRRIILYLAFNPLSTMLEANLLFDFTSRPTGVKSEVGCQAPLTFFYLLKLVPFKIYIFKNSLLV